MNPARTAAYKTVAQLLRDQDTLEALLDLLEDDATGQNFDYGDLQEFASTVSDIAADLDHKAAGR